MSSNCNESANPSHSSGFEFDQVRLKISEQRSWVYSVCMRIRKADEVGVHTYSSIYFRGKKRPRSDNIKVRLRRNVHVFQNDKKKPFASAGTA